MDCIEQCVNGRLAKSQLTFSSFFFDRSSRLRYITYLDRSNSVVNKIINQVTSDCTLSCKSHREPTDRRFHLVTTIVGDAKESQTFEYNFSRNFNRIAFYLRSTDHPVVSIYYQPRYYLSSLIISIGSVIGIWFGSCALDVDPFLFRLPARSHLTELKRKLAQLLFELGVVR